MLGLAPATAYPATEPLPWGDVPSVHAVGDIHVGHSASTTTHAATMNRDVARMDPPTLVVQIGDMTDDALSTQDVNAKAVMDAFPCDNIRTIVGNHDMNYSGGRDPAVAQAAWGYNDLQWTYDIGPVLCIGLSASVQQATLDPVVLQTADLDWLDATLAAATKPCWVFHHNMLTDNTAELPHDFSAQPDANVRAILNARPICTMWCAGHSHFDFRDVRCGRLLNIGSRNIIQSHTSVPSYVNQTTSGFVEVTDIDDPIRTLFCVPIDDEGNVDLWIRDHRYGEWMTWPITNERPRRLTLT